ncbi:sugar transporter protein [Purpureocillium lavendulum]|uniref:Sugar transporter protein n=1 Tax=Purpureocillium lavendulum TaxID=1247861 RepID=A0AB34FF51_9HYPO|nr:sugar transporter protein [Purpureocillium lavendulum]
MIRAANSSSSGSWTMPMAPQQLSIVDLFLPNFTSIGLSRLLAMSLSSYTPLVFFVGVLAFSRTYTGHLMSWLGEHFTSTVHIKRSDEAYDMVLTWLTTHGLETYARSTIARVGLQAGTRNDLVSDAKKPLSFSPWNGGFLFWFQKHLLSYRTELKDAGFHKEEEISITCAGRSCNILKEFLRECRNEYLHQVRNKTTIFENRGDRWKKVATKNIRPLSTVIVSEQQKQQLVADVKSFLDPETRDWFVKRTIPYRKGYLLYGPPGTGKSSFSVSVAGELDVDIYIISMPGVNDRTLKDLFADLPQKCVVLLEDIDAVGMERSPDSDDFDDEPLKSKNGVTMSGLLNTLDGVASQEGRVLIMTTNHIGKLDEALIRPGRVDKKAEFQYADAAMTSQLFGFVFQQEAGEDGSCNDSAVCDLAADFVAKVPELEFSPAEILSHLLQYRKSPTAAIEHTEEWVATMLREKGRLPTKAVSRLHLDGPMCKSEMASVLGRTVFDDDKDEEKSGLGFPTTPPSTPAQGSTGNMSALSQRGALALSAVGEFRDELTADIMSQGRRSDL